jgi:hypothetical protein
MEDMRVEHLLRDIKDFDTCDIGALRQRVKGIPGLSANANRQSEEHSPISRTTRVCRDGRSILSVSRLGESWFYLDTDRERIWVTPGETPPDGDLPRVSLVWRHRKEGPTNDCLSMLMTLALILWAVLCDILSVAGSFERFILHTHQV